MPIVKAPIGQDTNEPAMVGIDPKAGSGESGVTIAI